MYCVRCGTQLPDDAKFCVKCGAAVQASGGETAQPSEGPSQAPATFAPAGVSELKCPTCGAPIKPLFGEMVITCDYCGSSISLGDSGWRNLQKHTMLPLKLQNEDVMVAKVRELMDRGFLHRHLEEDSKQEELTLSYVPYWLVPVSARTSIVAADTVATVGTIATEAALFGMIAGGLGGGRRGGRGIGGLAEGAMLGTVMGGTGGGMNMRKAFSLNENYNFPIVAIKSFTQYQPAEYEFNLMEREIFDVGKLPKGVGIKLLNGDISEDMAKYQAKALVDQLQSQKAHKQYHMIQQMSTQMDVADAELLHTPIWFARYDHKGSKIVLVLDANSGSLVNSIGL
ncbi:MAG TPA: zinc ribbon domain-containing protein [Conexivisphaerales archaeon]|nr:zinc ribbon domain-containing protein [Conexivisphaerales archaeon]